MPRHPPTPAPAWEPAAARIRAALGRRRGLTERRMFGGIAFLLHGNMCCGVTPAGELVVRVGAERGGALAARPHARPCDFTGRPMRSMVTVAPAGFRTAAALGRWLDAAVGTAATLPPKPGARRS